MNERYRHELKYEISYSDYLAVQRRIKTVMSRDPHARNDGKYLIRSIYFDNYSDKALKEKLYGVSNREKFRIRYYNDDFSFITLEKKMKRSNLCMKFDAPLSYDELRRIISGDSAWMKSSVNPLMREFAVKLTTELLQPRVIVSYTREPYIYDAGNVRVTFDSDIRTTHFSQSFLVEQISDISATDCAKTMIMEVKYDDFLPDIISQLIQTNTTRVQAFSKYASCRRFG